MLYVGGVHATAITVVVVVDVFGRSVTYGPSPVPVYPRSRLPKVYLEASGNGRRLAAVAAADLIGLMTLGTERTLQYSRRTKAPPHHSLYQEVIARYTRPTWLGGLHCFILRTRWTDSHKQTFPRKYVCTTVDASKEAFGWPQYGKREKNIHSIEPRKRNRKATNDGIIGLKLAFLLEYVRTYR